MEFTAMDQFDTPQQSKPLPAAMLRPIAWDESAAATELFGDGGITDGQRRANSPERWVEQRRRVEYTLGSRVTSMLPTYLDKLRDSRIPLQKRAEMAAYLHRWHCKGVFGELSAAELQLVLMLMQAAGISGPAGGGGAAQPRQRRQVR